MSTLRRRIGFCGYAMSLTLLLTAFTIRAKEPTEPPRPMPADAVKLTVKSFSMNAYCRDFDGQWEGNCVASDGNCYFADSSHSNRHGAGFFRYNPRTGELKMLCEDITTICGEDPTKTPPQGKIHCDIIEFDGRLYFATHLANYWPEAEKKFTGAHVIAYELATEKFTGLGIVRPNYSCYSGINIDPVRKKLYVFVTPFDKEEWQIRGGGAHLYRIDPDPNAPGKTGTVPIFPKEDLGMVEVGSVSSFSLFIDGNGDCWFAGNSRWRNAPLYRVRATENKIERWDNALPERTDPNLDQPSSDQREIWWDWARALGDGKRCVMTIFDGGAICIFDSSRAPDIANASAAAAPVPAGSLLRARQGQAPEWYHAFYPLRRIGPTGLGKALAGTRVYYIQRANREDRQQNQGDDLHLMSVSIDITDLRITDHGLIVDQNGRRPWRIQSLSADEQGHVYMVGDWYLLPGEKGLLRYRGDTGLDIYEEQIRGQFFAVADVSGRRQNAPDLK